jgi:hypothetical protein
MSIFMISKLGILPVARSCLRGGPDSVVTAPCGILRPIYRQEVARWMT